MSYILDALRRADAERQRGQVPGLDARPMAGVLTEPRPHALGDGRRLAGLALLLAALALAAAAGWWWRSTPGLATPPSPPQALEAPMPAPGNGRPAQRDPPVPAVAPVLTAPPVPLASPAPPVPLASPAPPATVAPAVASPAAAPAAPAALAPLSPAAPAPSAPDTGPRSPPAWADLPEPIRREIGNLAVSGAMHGEQASLRMVVLNGQVLREGDRLTPDLQVQQIRLKSVVLSHRGQRFELPF